VAFPELALHDCIVAGIIGTGFIGAGFIEPALLVLAQSNWHCWHITRVMLLCELLGLALLEMTLLNWHH
jgi:hypothetical protein